MSQDAATEQNIGVINPYALVEIKLGYAVDWQNIADPKHFIQSVLDFPYEKLFDPVHGSPLYPQGRFDAERLEFVPHRGEFTLIDGENRLLHLTPTVLGAGAKKKTTVQWVDPGIFFTNAPDFAAPVQGGLPDCHFISAMAALAWSDPFAIKHVVRPVNASDGLKTGGAKDRILFYPGTGETPQEVEVTEFLPLIEPGNNFQYARSGHKGEIWPAVYEKAWVKWFTGTPSDHPDYKKVKGGSPTHDLVSLTGKTRHSLSTKPLSGGEIFAIVQSNCRGRWTFNPMVACTYSSAAKAPTKIDYATSGIVACHAYAILGWQESRDKKYIVLRNPWGRHEGTLHVDTGPWTSFDEFDGGDVVGTYNLPDHGVFALEAGTFQQYYTSFGWVD